MRIGCGTDIIEISRIKNSIQQFGDVFLNKIFTKREIEYCETKKNAKFQHYAARFAAKEAIYKAISSFEERHDAEFLDAEIINMENGKPKVCFLNKLEYLNNANVDISLSHCNDYAIATVVIVEGV